MKFKERIKSLRTERNLTQSQLAATLGKSEGAVRAWEIDRSKPDADTIVALAGYFGCTSDYLLGLSDYKNTREENEIATSRNILDESIAQINGGASLLKNLAMFADLANKREMRFIASKFLSTAGLFLHSLTEAAQLADELHQTQIYNAIRLHDCMLNTSAIGTMAKKNMQDITSEILHYVKTQTHDYGSKAENKIAQKFTKVYGKRELDNLAELDSLESLVYTNIDMSPFDGFIQTQCY